VSGFQPHRFSPLTEGIASSLVSKAISIPSARIFNIKMAGTATSEARNDAGVKRERYYRPELDCLRFFAFFAVFVYHTIGGRDAAYFSARGVPFGSLIASVASAGRFGVDLFFLLSAYLITDLLLREQEQCGKLDLRLFYVRRILRIWPLYFLGLLFGVLLPLADSSQYFPLKYAVAFVFMVGNWLPLHFHFQSVMWPLWSVSLEEQFYLLWPAFIFKAGPRRRLLYAAGVFLIVAPLARQFLLGYARAQHSEVLISSNTLARLDPLALGIATAVLLWKKHKNLGWVWRLSLLLAGCGFWLVVGHLYGLTRSFMLLGFPAIALGACLIFLSALGSPLAPRWLRYLGKISYGLYVFHMLAIHLSLKLWGGYVHNFRAFLACWCLSLLMTFAMAAASYKYFESPFLRLKERFTRVKSRPV
jgi:peptidoglycan/LPS O-acetylase OafA/YrhL